mgnify:FL=1
MNDDWKHFVPFNSTVRKVRKTWIDYNGHMNVAYYTAAFDKAIDEFLEKVVGIGPSFIKEKKQGSYALQTQYRYLKELLLENTFYVSIFVIDFKKNVIHLMAQMRTPSSQEIYASCETIMVNVDLRQRQSCEYPQFVFKKLSDLHEASKDLRNLTITGHSIGLRRRSDE